MEQRFEKEMYILIAEDDDGHAELIREGLREVGICNPILRFTNGKEVWDFLNENINSEDVEKNYRCLLLLDIKMPVMDGIELLKKIKGSTDFMDIPVIMLTTTDDPREVEECYRIGCNFYITKPVNFKKFTEILTRLGLFIQIVRL